MDREALVDKMAAAINDVGHVNDNSRAKARRALAAIESAGLKIMGREPTDAMDDAACDCHEYYQFSATVKQCAEFDEMFRAAWDAAPTYTDKGERA